MLADTLETVIIFNEKVAETLKQTAETMLMLCENAKKDLEEIQATLEDQAKERGE